MPLTNDPTPTLESRLNHVLPLPTVYMIEVQVPSSKSPFIACHEHLSAYIQEEGFSSFPMLTQCEYREFWTDSAPFFIPIAGCIFGMVVGPNDPIGIAHIPSGMHRDPALQRATVEKLLERAKADPDSIIHLAGFGERRTMSGPGLTDSKQASALVDALTVAEIGKRWEIFKMIRDGMNRLDIPLSRLALSVRGPSELSTKSSENAVAVIPRRRMCEVFYN